MQQRRPNIAKNKCFKKSGDTSWNSGFLGGIGLWGQHSCLAHLTPADTGRSFPGSTFPHDPCTHTRTGTMRMVLACPCIKICVWLCAAIGLGVCLSVWQSLDKYLLGADYLPGTVPGSGNQAGTVPAPLSPGKAGLKQRLTSTDQYRQKCSQQGEGRGAG